jgi:hypothetical protein
LGAIGVAERAVLQLCIPVALVSSVVNDTPVVAMMMPVAEKVLIIQHCWYDPYQKGV